MFSLKDVYLIKFKTYLKGNELLTDYTSKKNIPFNLKRVFLTGNVSEKSKRGSHAHKRTSQIFICLYGKINIRCFDGKKTIKIYYDSGRGFYLGVWSIIVLPPLL